MLWDWQSTRHPILLSDSVTKFLTFDHHRTLLSPLHRLSRYFPDLFIVAESARWKHSRYRSLSDKNTLIFPVMFRQSSHPQPNIVHHQIFIKHKRRRVSDVCQWTFLSYFRLFLLNTQLHGQTDTAVIIINTDYRYREEPGLMHTQPTEWSSRVGPFTFLINWCADTGDLDASPQSWLDCIRSGKKLSWSGKFVFISSFPALAAVCRRSVIHMRDGWWWGRGMAGVIYNI